MELNAAFGFPIRIRQKLWQCWFKCVFSKRQICQVEGINFKWWKNLKAGGFIWHPLSCKTLSYTWWAGRQITDSILQLQNNRVASKHIVGDAGYIENGGSRTSGRGSEVMRFNVADNTLLNSRAAKFALSDFLRHQLRFQLFNCAMKLCQLCAVWLLNAIKLKLDARLDIF